MIKDPYRPGLLYPARSNEEFDRLTAQHLQATRKAFEQASVLILTLGLTEAWVSKEDGGVSQHVPAPLRAASTRTGTRMSISVIAKSIQIFRRSSTNCEN